ncbi:hypothetical protein OYE22_19930 [Streptomyces sp. 71268]|uniref:hypothetical protein n=1 Tax=Streptomyces sp. 71268 TaxID=3002640 RepID=UPI0023F920D7|nr:hypothetical protein [Streptomyces sp. 71268]WEV27215.1 hypothetical protein OYE22_19930 [Streptomyces sp. 71268]
MVRKRAALSLLAAVIGAMLAVLLSVPTAQAAAPAPAGSYSAGQAAETVRLCEDTPRQPRQGEELPARSSSSGRYGTTQTAPPTSRPCSSTPVTHAARACGAPGPGGPDCASLGQHRERGAALPVMLQVFRC